MTYRKDLNISKPEKPLAVQADNTRIDVLGEETEGAYVEFEYEPRKDSEEALSEEELLDLDDGETFTIKVKPETEPRVVGSVRLHLPKEGEWDISVRTNNGKITYSKLGGRLAANSNNGKITVEEVKGSLNATCANGSVEGRNLQGEADISTSNGRITIRESSLSGGSVKSGNGRITLQFKPEADGTLSVFSGNGKVKLALPEDGDFQVKVQTRGKLYNHLENFSIQTQDDATIVQKGSGEYTILVQNYNGSVSLVSYEDIDKVFKEGRTHLEFNEDLDPGEILRNIFGRCDPSEFGRKWSGEFAEEIPKIMGKMAQFGSRFGKMGEEISRQFHEGRPRHKDAEIMMILDMLKEGKISAEEAEKLINALKAKHA